VAQIGQQIKLGSLGAKLTRFVKCT